MKKYYRVQERHPGAYNMPCDGIILVVDGENEWLLESRFCGMGEIRGGCYRQFVRGREKAWPKAAEKAKDRVSQMNEFMDGLLEKSPFALLSDLSAKQIRGVLGV